MQTSLTAQIGYYKTGANLPIESILNLWQEHCKFHEHQQRYDEAWNTAKQFLKETPIIVTDRFVIIESITVPTIIVPVIVRMLNLVHKGTKIITALGTTIYEPENNDLSKKNISLLFQSEYVYAKEKQLKSLEYFLYILRLMWYTVPVSFKYTDSTDRMCQYFIKKVVKPKKDKESQTYLDGTNYSDDYDPLLTFMMVE